MIRRTYIDSHTTCCESEDPMTTTLNVNGKSFTVDVPGDTPLLWTLRDVLGCGAVD